MAKFPLDEAGTIVLCQKIIAGLPSSNFTNAAVSSTDLDNQLKTFINKRDAATASAAAARQDVVEKNAEYEKLTDMMKSVLRHAENIAGGDDAELQAIGSGAYAQATSLQPPEQPRNLEVPTQGDGFVFLDWKEPFGGGAVAFYKIQRRERPAGAWEDAASAIPSEYTLINQPKAKELEYRVISVNRAGESTPSNSVMVVL